MATSNVTYTEAQKQEGRKLFADLREWGSKNGKRASSNMKLAGCIALLNDIKENLITYRQYDEITKVDSLITTINNYKLAEQERISAIIEARNNEATS